MSKLELNQVSRTSDCNNCGHCAELYTPKDDDPAELKETRTQVDNWLADIIKYRPTEGIKPADGTFLQ